MTGLNFNGDPVLNAGFRFGVSPVPEPAGVLAVGLAAVAGYAAQRRSRPVPRRHDPPARYRSSARRRTAATFPYRYASIGSSQASHSASDTGATSAAERTHASRRRCTVMLIAPTHTRSLR